MLLLVALLGALLTQPTPSTGDDPGLVLVRDAVGTPESTDTVLGWQPVPVADVDEGAVTVPNAYLDLLGPDPGTEPLAIDQWALGKIEIFGAWSVTTGDGDIVIAVVDSGLALDHPEFTDRLFSNPGEIPGNGVDDDSNGLVDDVTGWDIVDGDADPTDTSVGHGTEVAGVALASLNSMGIAGATPASTLLPIRACSTRCELFDVAWAVTYAVDMGADIVNLSLGGYAAPGPLADAVDYAEDAGVLVVTAAGNAGADIDGDGFVPAGLGNANLLAVAATDVDDELWPSSNYGLETIDIGAPGALIVTTTIETLGGYRTVSGTSFAAPYASGVAALMLAVDASLTPGELIERLGLHGAPLVSLDSRTAFGTRVRAHHSVVAALLTDIHRSIFVNDIVWLGVSGTTKGCNPPANDLFCPDRAVSRAEMAAFLHRALDLPAGPDAFDDDNQSIYQADINALAAAGITKGCNPPTNTLFCPHRTVTRAEMAAFLHRALD